MSNINFNDLEPGSIILTESPRVAKKSPYEADREYQVYTVVATDDKQAILKSNDVSAIDYHTLWVDEDKDGTPVCKLRGNIDYKQDSITTFPGVWHVSKQNTWGRNIPAAISSYNTLVSEVSYMYHKGKYTKSDKKYAQALYDLVQGITGADIADGNPAKLEAFKAALEEFFTSIDNVIASDNNKLMIARAKMRECYDEILEAQTNFPLPSPEGETVTLKKYDSYPNRLVYSGTFKEGDIYVVPKGNNQPAPDDLMFRVTKIEGSTVWVKGNTPDMLLGNLFVGDTDSPNNLYYLTMGGKLPVALGDVTRLPVTSFEDGVKYLAEVEEQNKALKTLYRELCDIFKDSQTEVIYSTFRRALLELRGALDCGSNAALAQLNILITETYDAPKRAKEAAKKGALGWLQVLAESVLG
jgi:hypothetical protein